jgi:hypothetical protein
MVDNYTIEIMRSTNNAVQTARVQDTSDRPEVIEEDEQTVNSVNT